MIHEVIAKYNCTWIIELEERETRAKVVFSSNQWRLCTSKWNKTLRKKSLGFKTGSTRKTKAACQNSVSCSIKELNIPTDLLLHTSIKILM